MLMVVAALILGGGGWMAPAFSSCASVFLSNLHLAVALTELVDMSILTNFTLFLEYQDGEATETKET